MPDLEIQYRELPTIEEVLKWRCLGQTETSERQSCGFIHSKDVPWMMDLPKFWENYSEGLHCNPPISREVTLGRKGPHTFILYENLLGEQVVIYYEIPLEEHKI